MTIHVQRVTRSRESVDHFLFSKTKTQPKEDKPPVEVVVEKEEQIEGFPAAPFGKSFIDGSLDRLASVYTFGALAIQIDNFAQAAAEAKTLADLAKTVDACCREDGGFWGRLSADRFGCFFPNKHVQHCPQIARKIQQAVSEVSTETVSIGIAGYPCTNYHKYQILENAQKALDHAAFFGPGSVVSFDSVSLNISGDKAYDDGDIHGAVEEFKRALLLDPSNVNIHNSMGVCYGILGQIDSALEYFETAIWLDSQEFMALYNIGVVHLMKGNREKALEYFLCAGGICEDVFEIAFETGKLYFEMNRPDEGRIQLKKAVRLQPKASGAFRCLGDCYNSLEQFDKAIAAYKAAVKLRPNDAAALSALGCLFDLQGENPEISTTFCRQSVDISPDNGLYRYRLGNLYLKQNRIEEALRELEAARHLGHDVGDLIEQIQNRLPAELRAEQSRP